VLRLLAVGVSHRTSPVELRERVDFARGGLDAAIRAVVARGVASEVVVLSTCNRAEVYAVVDSAQSDGALTGFFSEYHGVEPAELSEHLYLHTGPDAAQHLLRVAAGLDSLVVGEPQILGQVKAAYRIAQEQHSTGVVTNRLFHSAFAAGKRVRSETGLAEGAVSVSYAAIGLAKKIFGDLTGLNVLILGAGEMAKLTGIHLQSQRVKPVTIVSRNVIAADGLARQLGGRAARWAELDEVLSAADILITATGAAETVLGKVRVDEVMRSRRNRPLFVIDIAVPRDVEPSVGDLDQVFLYNIDDLRMIVQENLARRSSEFARAEAIVSEEVSKFSSWLNSREIIPTLVALRQRFEAIRRAELDRLAPKLAGLPPEASARLEEATRLILEKLLLPPTEQLKSVRDETMVVAYADALNRLFGLAVDEKVHEDDGIQDWHAGKPARTVAGK
jgi:glutamyl-tRNA reductase